eukprot:TRINITY_DN76952_c0_g1_i1.p1 TRINITY_DN76952_c0_g1~~TRINITY_DN76952_c0_g1_i1.p1  ORF type:complete len:795 (-),score=170.78 TRINITY_DN76952_c0_g1_i1:71-2455(-)
MRQPPNSARPSLNYVELRPTLVFEPQKLAAQGEKTERLLKSVSNGDHYEKRLQAHSDRVKRNLDEKRLKEQETARQAANQRLEIGFNLNFTSTAKGTRAKAKSKEPRQLPLLAAKIRHELDAHGNPDEEMPEPISKLLGREREPEERAENFQLGEEVEVRDKDMLEWRAGFVSGTDPLKVTLDDWDQAFQWDFVRHPTGGSKAKQEAPNSPETEAEEPRGGVQPAQFCICGYKFLKDAIFCSRCGRQRGCEILEAARPAVRPGKPPRPPSDIAKSRPSPGPRPPPPGSQSARSPRVPSHEGFNLERTRRSPSMPPAGPPQSEHRRDSTASEDFRVEVLSQNTQSSSSSRMQWHQNPPATCPGQRSSQWQQLTVPILAENGEVIAVRPAAGSQRSAWQQATVPILGENGEIIALRPAMGSSPMPEWKQTALPIFNEHGEVIALPSGDRCKWQQNTVPILGENGEVIALRPALSSHKEWKQQAVPIFGISGEVVALRPAGKLWEQGTVPIMAENGQVLGLRPSGEQYEMPAWAAHSGARNPAEGRVNSPGGARRAESNRLVSTATSSSAASDRTCLPAVPVQQGNGVNGGWRQSTESVVSESTMRPTAWLSPAAAGSEDDIEIESAISSRRGSMMLDPLEVVASEADEAKPGTLQARVLETSRQDSPSPSGLRAASPCTDDGAASCASFKEILKSASADSLASIDRILNMANAARQATPEGQMLQVLKDALVPDAAAPGSNASLPNLLLAQPPEAEELVLRLRMLPELWRSTILQMLEQAEAVQKASSDDLPPPSL